MPATTIHNPSGNPVATQRLCAIDDLFHDSTAKGARLEPMTGWMNVAGNNALCKVGHHGDFNPKT